MNLGVSKMGQMVLQGVKHLALFYFKTCSERCNKFTI